VYRLQHFSTPAYAATQQTACIFDIQHAADKLVTAGAPIDTNDYTEDLADQAIALINILPDIPPPLIAEAKFLILSSSLQLA
jgi:hypothetical protein